MAKAENKEEAEMEMKISRDIMEVMQKAARGEEITVAALGGSITEGFFASAKEKSYAGIMAAWWRKRFPKTPITYVNAGIGATDSYLGLHRAWRDVLCHEPDFMVVDFSVNDEPEPFYTESYDLLLKRLLQEEKKPALLALVMTMEDGKSAFAYHRPVFEKYDLPVVNYGQKVLAEIAKGQYAWADISPDDIHPNDRGHAIAGGMITEYLDRVYEAALADGAKGALLSDAAEGSAAQDAFSKTRIPAMTGRIDADLADAAELLSLAGDQAEAAGAHPLLAGGRLLLADGWQIADLHPHLHRGLLSPGGERTLAFELSFGELGFTYLKGVDGTMGKAEVYVDGVLQKTLDGDFSGGWGDYGFSERVYLADEKEPHRVELRASGRFAVLAVLSGSFS